EEWSQVGVDLGLDVAGQETEPLPRLDGWTRQDDAADVAAGERGGGHRDREERLAGTGRTDPEGDGVVSDRVDVALLVDGLRRDPGVAVVPDGVLEDLRRALVLVEGARDRLDRARCDLVSLFDQVDELPHHSLRRSEVGRIAVECEDVPAQEYVDVE